jgi:hypothetical protein
VLGPCASQWVMGSLPWTGYEFVGGFVFVQLYCPEYILRADAKNGLDKTPCFNVESVSEETHNMRKIPRAGVELKSSNSSLHDYLFKDF